MNAGDQLPAWIQTGGVLAFAAIVWFELRAVRPTLEKLQRILAAMLERERIREGGTGPMRAISPAAADVFETQTMVPLKRDRDR